MAVGNRGRGAGHHGPAVAWVVVGRDPRRRGLAERVVVLPRPDPAYSAERRFWHWKDAMSLKYRDAVPIPVNAGNRPILHFWMNYR